MTSTTRPDLTAATDDQLAELFGTVSDDMDDAIATEIDTRLREHRTSLVLCHDTASGAVLLLTAREAAAGMLRYAHSLGQGTPACAAWEERAVRMARTGRAS